MNTRKRQDANSAAVSNNFRTHNSTQYNKHAHNELLRFSQTRQLLSVLYALEKEHLLQEQKCSSLSKRVREKMERTRLKSLTTSDGDTGGEKMCCRRR